MATDGERIEARPVEATLGAALLAAAALAWALAVHRMRGMDMGPGTDLGGLSFFAPTWAVMMAAMMIPSATPAVLRTARRARPAGSTPALWFAACYLLVWLAGGLAVFGADRVLRELHPGFLAWDRAGVYLAAAAIALAGLYELAPVKARCLSRCRRAGGEPVASAPRAGLAYGLDCIGCSGALMGVMLVLGPMSLIWMALVSVLVLAEKTAPQGMRVIGAVAVGLLVLALWIALDAASVPGLTIPM